MDCRELLVSRAIEGTCIPSSLAYILLIQLNSHLCQEVVEMWVVDIQKFLYLEIRITFNLKSMY